MKGFSASSRPLYYPPRDPSTQEGVREAQYVNGALGGSEKGNTGRRGTEQAGRRDQLTAMSLGLLSHLQAVGQELVHLGHARRDAEVDGSIANLNDEATDNVRVDLWQAGQSLGEG